MDHTGQVGVVVVEAVDQDPIEQSGIARTQTQAVADDGSTAHAEL